MTPGDVIHGLPAAKYHAHRATSKSLLDAVAISPQHYLAARDGPPREQTPAMLLGSATHCAVLEPEDYADRYVTDPAPGSRSKDAQAARQAERDAGREILTTAQAATVEAITNSVLGHRIAATLLDQGYPEVSFCWEDRETHIICRSRADWWNSAHAQPLIVDLKTARDASAGGFARAVVDHRYHVQAAMYSDGWLRVTGEQPIFVFIVVESSAPYCVALYTLSDDDLQLGRALYRRDLARLRECADTGAWPGYADDEIRTLTLPPWARRIDVR